MAENETQSTKIMSLELKRFIFAGASRPVAVPYIGKEESPGNIERHTS